MANIPIKMLLNQVGSYFQAIQSEEVVVNGHRSRYLAAGSNAKPTLVFLHGLAGSKAQWRNLMNGFAKDYRVIAPDIPGFCLGAPFKNSRHTLNQLMAWLDEFLEALNVKEVHLVAYSTAAPVAAVYSGSRDFVKSIAFVCFPDVLAPTFSGKGKAFQLYRERINFQSMEDWDAFFREAFYQPVSAPVAIKRYNYNKFKRHNDAFISVIDDLSEHQPVVMPNLKRVTANTLVVNASHDVYADSEFHELLKVHLPHAQHVLIERCGHMAFIDRYEEVLDTLRAFFSEQVLKELKVN